MRLGCFYKPVATENVHSGPVVRIRINTRGPWIFSYLCFVLEGPLMAGTTGCSGNVVTTRMGAIFSAPLLSFSPTTHVCVLHDDDEAKCDFLYTANGPIYSANAHHAVGEKVKHQGRVVTKAAPQRPGRMYHDSKHLPPRA